MSQHSIVHNSFVIERQYEVSPERVYAAWADSDAKARWFGAPGGDHEMDFRIGGKELNRGTAPDGTVYTYDARYEDVVPDNRIVYTYFMLMNDLRISVSVVAVEFHSAAEGTRLVYTEHAVFLDGHDDPKVREDGTNGLLDGLGRYLDA